MCECVCVEEREGGVLFYLSATSTTDCGGRRAPVCYQPIPLPVFLQFWGFGKSHILFFSGLFFFFFFRSSASHPSRDSPAHPEDREQDDEDGRARGDSHHGRHP